MEEKRWRSKEEGSRQRMCEVGGVVVVEAQQKVGMKQNVWCSPVPDGDAQQDLKRQGRYVGGLPLLMASRRGLAHISWGLSVNSWYQRFQDMLCKIH